MKNITVSAPGKLLLFGEHAVVYGELCVVTAVDKRLQVALTATTEEGCKINAPQVKDTRFVETAIKQFSDKYTISLNNLLISTRNQFSSNFGFGSSSAVTVAVLYALSLYYGKTLSKKELFNLAYKVVLDIQGVGSGFDIASAIWGGTLLFKKGADVCESIPVKSLPIVVGYTGEKADTTQLVKEVAAKRNNQPEKFAKLMKAIGEIVRQVQEPLKVEDWERVGKFMDFNQEYLRDLGVSSEKLELLIFAAKKAGAYGAKLSGAGRGDCMIAIVSEEKRERIEEAIVRVGGEVLPVSFNAEGVKVEV